MTNIESIILIAYRWNGIHVDGIVTNPGTTGFVVTADGTVIAHAPYTAERIQVGIVSYEDDEPVPYYGPEVRC